MTYKTVYWDATTQSQKERDCTTAEIAEVDARKTFDASAARVEKNTQINNWRNAANQSYFTHMGKQFACDENSKWNINSVAGNINLIGAFPTDFPGQWKAMDNTYLTISTIAQFKDFYAAMTAQGVQNFIRSEQLKAALATAMTRAEIEAIVW